MSFLWTVSWERKKDDGKKDDLAERFEVLARRWIFNEVMRTNIFSVSVALKQESLIQLQ